MAHHAKVAPNEKCEEVSWFSTVIGDDITLLGATLRVNYDSPCFFYLCNAICDTYMILRVHPSDTMHALTHAPSPPRIHERQRLYASRLSLSTRQNLDTVVGILRLENR